MTAPLKMTALFLCLWAAGGCSSAEEKNNPHILAELGEAIKGDEVIPRALRTAYVMNVRNQTYESGFSQLLSRKIRFELEKRGRLLLVESREKAHILVYPTLVFYKLMPVTFDTLGRPIAMDAIAAAKIKVNLAKPGPGQEPALIAPTRVDARVHYNVRGGAVLMPFEANERLSNQLAARIALTVETGWYTELKTDRELGRVRSDEGIIGQYDKDEIVKRPNTANKTEEEEIQEIEEKSLGITPPATMEDNSDPVNQ